MKDQVLIDLARNLLDLLEKMNEDWGREFDLEEDDFRISCGVCGENLNTCRQIHDPRCS